MGGVEEVLFDTLRLRAVGYMLRMSVDKSVARCRAANWRSDDAQVRQRKKEKKMLSCRVWYLSWSAVITFLIVFDKSYLHF